MHEEVEADIAILQQDLWKSISLTAKDRHLDRIGISLGRFLESPNLFSSISPLVCWAICDSTVSKLILILIAISFVLRLTYFSFNQNLLNGDSTISCPRSWKTHYKNVLEESKTGILQQPVYFVAPVNLVPLSEIVLATYSTEALEFSQNQSCRIENYLIRDRRILRLGITFTCHEATSSNISVGHEYEVRSLSPFLQGYLDPSRTRLIVTLFPRSKEKLSPSDITSISANDYEAVLTEHSLSGEDAADHLLEIDERFLASYTLWPSSKSNNTRNDIDSLKRSGSYSLKNGSNEDSLSAELSHDLLSYKHNNLRLSIRAVPQEMLNFFSKHSLHDENSMIFVQTSDLGKISAFNGDWVGALPPFNKKVKLVSTRYIERLTV